MGVEAGVEAGVEDGVEEAAEAGPEADVEEGAEAGVEECVEEAAEAGVEADVEVGLPVVAGGLLGGGDWTHLLRWPVGGGGRGPAPAGPALEDTSPAVLRVGLRDMLLEGEVRCPDGGVGSDGGEVVLDGVTLLLERTVDRFLADRLMLLVAGAGGSTGGGEDGGGGADGDGADGDGAELGVMCMGE